jgi:hypothetical protein
MKHKLQKLAFAVALAAMLIIAAIAGILAIGPHTVMGAPQDAPLLLGGNRVTLTVHALSQNSAITTAQVNSDSDGHKFYNNGKTLMMLVNAYTDTITVTFVTPGSIGGLAIADLDIVVPAGVTRFAGPFDPVYFNQSSTGNLNYVFMNYSAAVTGSMMTVGAYRLP